MNRVLICACILTFGLISACKSSDEQKSVLPKSIKVEQISELASVVKSYTGSVQANQSSKLAFKMGGLIQNTYVASGQSVKKGELLIELDPQEVILDCSAKRVAMATQNEALKRAERLYERNAISKQEYETIQASYESAKSAYEIAERNVADTKIYAPFDGFILDKFVNQYDRVMAGTPVLEIVNPKDLEIKFTVPESNALFFTKETELFVEFDTYKGELFKCKLKQLISASPDGAGIPFKLEIVDPNFDLAKYRVAVGFSCNIIANIVNTQYSNLYSLPISSVVPASTGSGTYVMVYNPSTSTVKRVEVEMAPIVIEDGRVAVKGNLAKSDQVVVAGASLLNDNQKVNVLSK